jgi:hypothetical protein
LKIKVQYQLISESLANRICPLCRSEVEDEFHFSMICDKLKDIHDKFFQKLTDIVPLFSNRNIIVFLALKQITLMNFCIYTFHLCL